MGLIRVHSRALPGAGIHPDPGRGGLGERRRSRGLDGVCVVVLRVWGRHRVIVLTRGGRLTVVRNRGRLDQHIVDVEIRRA